MHQKTTHHVAMSISQFFARSLIGWRKSKFDDDIDSRYIQPWQGNTNKGKEEGNTNKGNHFAR